MRDQPRTARLVITPATVVVLFGAIVVAILLRNVLVAARRPIGWTIAALVLAAAIEPAVSLVQRKVTRRGIALVIVLVPVLGFIGLVAWGVFQDLDRSTDNLKAAIPQAAESIEASERFGEVATDFDLRGKADQLVDALERPSAGLAEEAVGSAGAWLVCLILTVFALGWGPRFGRGALQQITDPEQRYRVAKVSGRAFTRSQRYIDFVLVQGVMVGGLSWALYRMLDVPAPTPLAVLTGVLSAVPVVGILLGGLPAVLLVPDFASLGRPGMLLGALVVMQVVQVFAFRQVTGRTIYIGPAITVIAFLIGSSIYGLGGAVFGTAIAVFAIALADAAAAEIGARDLPPEAADPTDGSIVPEIIRDAILPEPG